MAMKDVGTEPLGQAYETVEPKKYYPRLSLALDDFPELNEIGKEVILKVKGCVKSISENDNGGTVDLEVYECGVENEASASKADKSYAQLRGGH